MFLTFLKPKTHLIFKIKKKEIYIVFLVYICIRIFQILEN